MTFLRGIFFILSILVFLAGVNYFGNARTIMEQNFAMNHFILAMVLFLGFMKGRKK